MTLELACGLAISFGLLTHSALLVRQSWHLCEWFKALETHDATLSRLIEQLQEHRADPETRRLACVGTTGPEVVDVFRPPATPPVSTPARRHQTPKDQIALIERLDPNYVPPPQPDYDDVPVCCKACGRIDGDITEWICPECAAALHRGREVEGAL